MQENLQVNPNQVEQIPISLLNMLPTELVKEAPRLIEKYLNDSHQQKIAQVEFQKSQLALQSQQLEHQIKQSEQNHLLSLKQAENYHNQHKLGYRSQWQGLAFKGFIYISTLSVFTYLAITDSMNDVLSTVFGITALSVLGIDVAKFFNNTTNRQ